MSELAEIAKTWLATPFKNGASIKGQGCDCVGFLEGMFAELGHTIPSRLGMNLEQGLESVDFLALSNEPKPGDILLLAQENGVLETQNLHVAILIENNQIIHSHWNRGVILNRFGSWFQNRLKKSYRYLGNKYWQL